MIKKDYGRLILSLTDIELEKFIRDWVDSKKSSYVEVTRFSGAGDLGRDVVGFLSKERHEGSWHNYQCKQYAKTLPTDIGLCEIGKILYYAFQKEFSAPAQYFFVAPKGVNRNLERLIFNPSQFKTNLILEWDKYCAKKIIDGKIIPLNSTLKIFIEDFDFSTIRRLNLDDIINDPSVKSVLFKWFGVDPGSSPTGSVPFSVSNVELPYINQLIHAYSQREAKVFINHEDVAVNHPEFSEHLSRQRERFYHADAFKRFYRDNTDQSVIDNFEEDIFHGVIDKCNASHADALSCVDAVMSQAANLQPSGVLAHHARVPIKQGICHHFANEGRLKWKK